MNTLKNIKCGETVKVVKVNGTGRDKAADDGYGYLLRGTSIYIRKVAPLGDPVEVTLRG